MRDPRPMRDPDDATQAEVPRAPALAPATLEGVLQATSRLQLRHDETSAMSAVAAELARAAGLDAAALARAEAERRLAGALTGLTAGDRRWFRLKRLVAGLPGSLLPGSLRPGPAHPAPGARVRAHVLAARANAARKAGSSRLSVWLAHRALAHDPACYKAWYELGRTLELAGRLEEACDAYRLAVEHGVAEGPAPGDPFALSSALNNLAILVEGALDDAVVEAMYQHALLVRPSNGIAAYNLALLHKMRGRYAEAAALLARAKALRPDDADVARELGIVQAAAQAP